MGVVVVAVSYYLGLVRLAVLCGGITWASDLGTLLSLYFAQSLFSLPRDATGKIVCSNCHLQSASVDFTGPQRLFIRGLREKPTSIFRAIRSNAQLRSDGTIGPLQVGMVLVVGEGITIQSPGWLDWSATLAGALVLGPSSSRSTAGQTISLNIQTHQISTRSLYLGANRGRGQLYPDGSPSNLSLRKAEVPGPCLA
jgi:apocytochrome f